MYECKANRTPEYTRMFINHAAQRNISFLIQFILKSEQIKIVNSSVASIFNHAMIMLDVLLQKITVLGDLSTYITGDVFNCMHCHVVQIKFVFTLEHFATQVAIVFFINCIVKSSDMTRQIAWAFKDLTTKVTK